MAFGGCKGAAVTWETVLSSSYTSLGAYFYGMLEDITMFSLKKKKGGEGGRKEAETQKLLFPESKLEAGLYTELLDDCRVVENGSKSEVLLEDQQEYVEHY